MSEKIRVIRFSNIWNGPLAENVQHKFAAQHALNIYRSKSDLKNLNNDANESIKFHNLLNIIFLINETRNFKSEIELIQQANKLINK